MVHTVHQFIKFSAFADFHGFSCPAPLQVSAASGSDSWDRRCRRCRRCPGMSGQLFLGTLRLNWMTPAPLVMYQDVPGCTTYVLLNLVIVSTNFGLTKSWFEHTDLPVRSFTKHRQSLLPGVRHPTANSARTASQIGGWKAAVAAGCDHGGKKHLWSLSILSICLQTKCQGIPHHPSSSHMPLIPLIGKSNESYGFLWNLLFLLFCSRR